MQSQSLMFFIVVFIAAAAVAAAVAWLLVPDRFRKRVADIEVEASASSTSPSAAEQWIERLVELARPFAKLSLPPDGWEDSPIRLRFVNAGWRGQSAPMIFFGLKTLLAIGLPLLLLLFAGEELYKSGSHMIMLWMVGSAYVGYYAPNLALNHKIRLRQREIFESFPDALDLLTICVEAGLGLDAALSRVANEIHIKSLVLAQELQLVLMELRAGFPKDRALRNLALRTGVEDIDLLVAMLIQSDRFGTSMGESLRIHSDNLRTKRRQRAEEAAAKISLKLLFPLIFMIFPTLMVIMVGPAGIQIYRVLLPAMGGE